MKNFKDFLTETVKNPGLEAQASIVHHDKQITHHSDQLGLHNKELSRLLDKKGSTVSIVHHAHKVSHHAEQLAHHVAERNSAKISIETPKKK